MCETESASEYGFIADDGSTLLQGVVGLDEVCVLEGHIGVECGLIECDLPIGYRVFDCKSLYRASFKGH